MGSPDASRAVAIAGEVPGLGAAGPKVNEGSAGLREGNFCTQEKLVSNKDCYPRELISFQNCFDKDRARLLLSPYLLERCSRTKT